MNALPSVGWGDAQSRTANAGRLRGEDRELHYTRPTAWGDHSIPRQRALDFVPPSTASRPCRSGREPIRTSLGMTGMRPMRKRFS